MTKGSFTGKGWGAVVDVTVHAPAQKVRLKDETSKLAADNNASTDAVAVLAERIPAGHAKALYNAGQAIRNHVDRVSVKINGQNVVPVPELPRLWITLYGHENLNSHECVGGTGLVCKYNALKAGLIELCENGELDRIIAEKAGNLANQITRVDCNLLNEAFGVDIRLDIDCDSEVVRTALNQLSANVRESIEAKAAADAERAAGEAVSEVTGHAIAWIEKTLTNVIERVGGGEKGTHYKTLIASVTELVDRLPAYNLTGDGKVSNAIVAIRERLAKVMDADTLRDSDAARSTAVDAAKAILADLNPVAAVANGEVAAAGGIDPLDNVKVG